MTQAELQAREDRLDDLTLRQKAIIFSAGVIAGVALLLMLRGIFA